MLDYLIANMPVLIGMVVYLIRLEIRLAKICTDLDWIKKGCTGCQQNSGENTD